MPIPFKICSIVLLIAQQLLGLTGLEGQAPNNQAGKKATSKTAQPSAVKDQNCGCEYFPLCNWEATKVFAGKTYKGYNDEEGNMVWFNCDNGVVTRKWTTTYVPVSYESSYDPFSNKTVETYYEGSVQKELHTMVFLKYNLPERSTWSLNDQHWRIIKKGLTITEENVTYKDVIKVLYQRIQNKLVTESFYYYYGKGVGSIKTEKGSSRDGFFAVLNDLQEDLGKQGKLAGDIDEDMVGKWTFPGNNEDHYLELYSNGLGLMYSEPRSQFGIYFKDMSGYKLNPSMEYFIWRVDNGLRIRTLDNDNTIKNVRQFNFTRTKDKRSSRPALDINGQVYVSQDKWDWNLSKPAAGKTEVILRKPDRNLKGKIDQSIVGRWQSDIKFTEDQNFKLWYTFKKDGTYEYTSDQSTEIANGQWRVDGDYLELLSNDEKVDVVRIPFKKINQQSTGKAALSIRTLYVTTDKRPAW